MDTNLGFVAHVGKMGTTPPFDNFLRSKQPSSNSKKNVTAISVSLMFLCPCRATDIVSAKSAKPTLSAWTEWRQYGRRQHGIASM